MDKAQNELSKSYWHSRKAANEQSSDMYGYEPYELTDYSLENVIDPEDLKYSGKGLTLAKYIEMFPDKLEEFMYSIRTLKSSEVAKLLGEKPEYLKYYNGNKLFNNFSGHDTANLLIKQPQFADKFNFEDKFPNNNVYPIFNLLENRPEFANKFNFEEIVANTKYIGTHIQDLIIKQPQFIDEPILKSALENHDLYHIIVARPELMKKIDPEKLGYYKREVVLQQPQLVKYFKDILTNHEIGEILVEDPKFWDVLDTSGISGFTLGQIVKRQPKLINVAVDGFDTGRIGTFVVRDIITQYPETISKFNMDKLEARDLQAIFEANSETLKYTPKEAFNKFTGFNLSWLLEEVPEAIEYVNLAGLDSYEIRQIITANPEFAKKFDLSEMSGYQIKDLIVDNPEALKYLKSEISRLTNWDIEEIIRNHPKLEKYFKDYQNG